MILGKKNQASCYHWQGIKRSGEKVSGVMYASNIASIQANLRQNEIIVRKIIKKRALSFNKADKKIKSTDIILFFRQLSSMLTAGIPLIHAFDTIIKGSPKNQMKNLLKTIKADIENGLTLSDSLRKHPVFFNQLVFGLVKAAEKSGKLAILLSNIAIYKEKILNLTRKIKKALTYPVTVLITAGFVTIALLFFVIPQFESLFKSFNAELPLLTRLVIYLSQFCKTYWHMLLGLLCAGTYGFRYAYKLSPSFVFFIEKITFKLPIIGSVLEKVMIARFTRTLGILCTARIPLVNALKSVGQAMESLIYVQGIDHIKQTISRGEPLHFAMETTNLFPSMVIQMVAIGEESGSLDQMLNKAADFYDNEVDTAFDTLTSLLEPMIMAILGILIGGLVIAMYLPIFKLGSVV